LRFKGSGFRVQSLGFRVEFMVKDSRVVGVPCVQENATEENAPDSTHAFLNLRKRHRPDEKGTDRILTPFA